jgi:signal transduction histidine kinase
MDNETTFTESKKPLILVADDDPNSQQLLDKLLHKNNFRVQAALDGQTAIDLAQTVHPDLILMDIQMPGLDGFEAVRLLRDHPTTNRVPIIVLTAAAREPTDVAKGLGLGADDYLRKPFNISELVARVNSKISARRLEEKLQQRTQELEALVRIGTELNQGLNLDQLADRLLSAVMDHIASTAAIFVLIEENGQPILWRTSPADLNTSLEGILARVLATGEAVLIPDIHAESQPAPIFAHAANCVSGVAVPLKNQNQIIGVLALGDLQSEHYGNGDLRVLRSIAQQAALAARNAQLYAQLEGYAHNLESMVEARTNALAQTQAQLIRAEKLAALGTLAAGVAHEINNPLQAMLPNLEGALEDLTAKRGVDREAIEITINSVQRIQRIVSQLLDFARPAQSLPVPVDVNDAMAEVLALAGKQLQHAKIDVKTDLKATHTIVGSADQLKQVFLNLVVNAMEAMPNGGTLTVKTSEKADLVQVSVIDTGSGIGADILPHIFNPFFTTKADGTGLGLAVSYTIIEGHGGEIAVDSKPGSQTEFTVQLPFTRQED